MDENRGLVLGYEFEKTGIASALVWAGTGHWDSVGLHLALIGHWACIQSVIYELHCFATF